MYDQSTYHILLLPPENYWGWVGAVREYAIKYGVSITPSPQKAALFHRPNQLISVVAANSYGDYGDIVLWLQHESPDASLDVLKVADPESLRGLLGARVAANDPLAGTTVISHRLDAISVPPQKPSPNPTIDTTTSMASSTVAELGISLLWPTDYPEKLQEFGENPDLYRRWGLPGHDGIDFKAPLNSNVYVCADGQVHKIHDGSGGHPYGIHIWIRHSNGYSTIYAHLNHSFVDEGQVVKAGERIGLANSTGNSTTSQLHLTLKKDGATEAGLTPYPHDIIDPTPFLVFPAGRKAASPASAAWSFNHCLVGVNGRIDGPMQEADWKAVKTARVESVKLTTLSVPEDVVRAQALNPEIFVLVRLAADFRNRAIRASDFANWIQFDLGRYYEKGVRYFEVHNEPNLAPEGFGSSWRTGEEFGTWFVEVVGLLKPTFPEAKFGWPGLSPGDTEGMRFSHRAFLESAASLVSAADWIGCHCYWQTDMDIFEANGGLGYQLYRDLWPDKLIFITEFSNPSARINSPTKGNEYVTYYHHLRNIPGVGAAFAFATSAAANYQYEVWRSESGQQSEIPSIIGDRTF